tara:strand:+ start:1056 stop:1235 length:180 start_codon:yes stop_codon:yes gene_type:complete
MAKYQKIDETFNGKTITVSILKKEDVPANTRITIPLDEANTDYQEYLEWAKTNTAEAAD